MVLNKFGKREAEGRGFRALIADALAMDIPMIVGLGPDNRTVFEDFACGLAISLPAGQDAIRPWALSVSVAPPRPA